MNLTNDSLLDTHMLWNNDTYRCGPGWDSFHLEYSKIHGWVSLLVCSFGSIANVLNIAVLTRREMSSPTNALLTGLAVADLLVMLQYIPYAIHMYLYKRSRRDTFSYGWAVFVLIHSMFTQVCHTVSISLTVLLAIWRYIAVAHPQRNREWCSYRRTMCAIVSVCIICPLICSPLFLTTEVRAKYEILTLDGNMVNWNNVNTTEIVVNETLWVVDVRETVIDSGLLKLLNFYMYSVVIKLLPCVALTILSLRLIKALMDAKKRRKLLTSSALVRSSDDKVLENSFELKRSRQKPPRVLDKERQTDRTTRMLLAVLLLFLLTEFPQGVLGVLSVVLGDGFFRTCYVKLGELMDILALINSAINFILYCAMSRQFRTTFSQLFCRWKILGRWRWTPVPQHLDNNGHTATTHTMTQVTQV